MGSRQPLNAADGSVPFFAPPDTRAAGAGRRSVAVFAVIVLHLALIALLGIAAVKPEIVQPVRALAVRMLEAPRTQQQTVEPVVKPATAPVKSPAPQVLAAPRRADAPAPFAVAPQSDVPASAEVPPVAAAPASAPVMPARFDADYLQNPKPVYPPMSRRQGEEGKVIMRVKVSAQGVPLSVEISQSSGFSRLDEAAKAAVERWRFVPAKQGGEAIDSSVLVPLSFALSN